MSILKGKLPDGTVVYSSQGEDLRNQDIICINCKAKMYIKRYPQVDDEYYFALKPGENHTSVCQYYDGDEDKPLLILSIDELVDFLSKPSSSSEEQDKAITSHSQQEDSHIEPKERQFTRKIKSIKKLSQIIKTGIYDEEPFNFVAQGSQLRFIDSVIFDKWARLVWQDSMVNIGARIVDARWVGSFEFKYDNIKKRITNQMKKTKEIWFCTFWKSGNEYKKVYFCLDCSHIFNRVKNKIFRSGINEKDGTFIEFMSKKGEKLDTLIAGRWGMTDKDYCHKNCPVKLCEGCLGAYWACCNNVKQIELFPADELTKNKEKSNIN